MRCVGETGETRARARFRVDKSAREARGRDATRRGWCDGLWVIS